VYTIEQRRKVLLNTIRLNTSSEGPEREILIVLAEEIYSIADSFNSIAISLETLVKQGEAAAELQRAFINGTLPPRKEKSSGRNRKS
jgi:hypothetical protein